MFLFFKRRKVFWLLLLIPFIFPFLYYFLLHFEARYVLLFLPFLTILAGYGLGQMLNLLKIKSNLVIIVIVLALIFIPLKNAVIFDKLLSQTDTRILAKNWIENNLSYGSKIIINSSEFNLIKSADCIYNQQQTRNLSLRSRDYIMWDQDRPESYCVWPLDLTQVLPSNVNEYEYYLTDAYTIRRTRHLGEELTPRLELIKEFQGSPHVLVETWPNRFVHDILRVKKTGPTVKIYRLK